ncbi:MAG TPA: hypothetical protein VL727_10560 [Puia sp.]|jgi:hypothetical protein|nr:hypothetical protein [Puia sp.]
MFKTGNSSIDYLLVVIIFLPLFSALLIFGRKLYLQEPLNFLLIVCLLSFFKGLLELTYPLTKENLYIINKIFSLILLLLLVPCFRPRLNARYRYILDILLTALLTLAITYWSLVDWERPSPGIDTLLNAFLGMVILVSLPTIIRTSSLQIFRSPLFWIGSGTLFYILLYLLLEGIGCCRPLPSPPDPEKRLFLLLADLVKYSFYLIAASATKPSSAALPRTQ